VLTGCGNKKLFVQKMLDKVQCVLVEVSSGHTQSKVLKVISRLLQLAVLFGDTLMLSITSDDDALR
jgi:hypothetical protein